ncbi:MAG TPA: ATP-binding protein [Nitrososphaeraceae archaeon]
MELSSTSRSAMVDTESTLVYYGSKKAIETELRFFRNAEKNIDICMNYTRPLLAIRTETVKKSIIDAKNRGVKIRYLTEITKDNIDYCRELMEIVDEVKHLEGIMGNFMVSDAEYLAPIAFGEETKVAAKVIFCNINSFVEQQQYFFDMLWNRAETISKRIAEIEEGIKADFIETMINPYEVQKLAFELIKYASNEILVIFSTANAFRRQIKSGTVRFLNEASLRGLDVRILTPFGEKIEKIVEEFRVIDQDNFVIDSNSHKLDTSNQGYLENPKYSNVPKIRLIQPQLQTKVSILIVDRKYSLVVELKDDSKETSIEAMGLTSYSNSKSTVSTYVSIFYSLWTQLDLYEQLKESNKQQELLIRRLQNHDDLQREFINVAAHELRTPVQPILGLADLLSSKKGDIKQYQEFITIIGRNARRLKHLTEDILDVSRIDGNSLELRQDVFDLVRTITELLDDSRKDQAGLANGPTISFECTVNDALVLGDKQRICQVIQNLLDNAFNFTKSGSITVSLSATTQNAKEWNIAIKDTGKGIDLKIMPRLFTKFATKSENGIGLGLYISKSIIEAHGGKIWANNNTDSSGATFGFCLSAKD